MYQGSEYYDADFGNSGWVVSRGGRLFFVTVGYIVTDITPKIAIVTTADFIVPGLGGSVSVFINSETVLSIGETVFIDSGQYIISARATDQLTVMYAGGAANATAKAGAGVLDQNSVQIFEYQTNPAEFDFVHIFQAENFMIVLCDPHKTIIFDGSHSRQAHEDEIPTGVLGCYGWGRIWITLADRRSFLAGNLVFDQAGGGTAQQNFRDSILKFTDNDFLNEGGAFGVPYNAGKITSMVFYTAQDTSLGQGVLLVGTQKSIFSVNAPVDRTTWKSLTYPIQTIALIGVGPKGPRSTISKDGDVWFRSKDGIRSFVIARRNFGVPGNVPQSHEIGMILANDTKSLLFYSSGVEFDNRVLMTVAPQRTSVGVHHVGIAAVNFDEISSLHEKSQPSWESFWSGLDIFQLIACEINDDERCFAFVNGPTDIEFWELFSEDDTDSADVNENVTNGVTTLCRTPLKWSIDSRADPHGDPRQLKSLQTAELYLDQITDNVTITVKFRPDQYPAWVTWTTINVCAPIVQCTLPTQADKFSCVIWQTNATQYASRMMLPQPPDMCVTPPKVKVRRGREFQYRLEGTGNFRIRSFIVHAEQCAQENEGTCQGLVQCIALPNCDIPIFNFNAHGTCQSGGVTTYFNTRQCQMAFCPAGTTGASVTVCVDAGKFSSIISQADADQQAMTSAFQQAKSQLSCQGSSSCSNFVPTMSSPSNVNGTASDSSENAVLPGWKAFDKLFGTLNSWKSNGAPPQWVQMQLAVGKTAKAYRTFTNASAWKFQGSNDGVTFTTLDTQTGQVVDPVAGGLYLISNLTNYTYYRFLITAGPGGSLIGNVEVAELQMFECQTPS
jgi:hypothetical protein